MYVYNKDIICNIANYELDEHIRVILQTINQKL